MGLDCFILTILLTQARPNPIATFLRRLCDGRHSAYVVWQALVCSGASIQQEVQLTEVDKPSTHLVAGMSIDDFERPAAKRSASISISIRIAVSFARHLSI